jgi:hypothetical protein
MRSVAIKAILLMAAISSVSTFESYLKARAHKDMIENVFRANLPLIIEKARANQKKTQEHEEYVPELKATVNNIFTMLKSPPDANHWKSMGKNLEMMIDGGQIIFEMHEPTFIVEGTFTEKVDKKQTAKASIEIKAIVNTF